MFSAQKNKKAAMLIEAVVSSAISAVLFAAFIGLYVNTLKLNQANSGNEKEYFAFATMSQKLKDELFNTYSHEDETPKINIKTDRISFVTLTEDLNFQSGKKELVAGTYEYRKVSNSLVKEIRESIKNEKLGKTIYLRTIFDNVELAEFYGGYLKNGKIHWTRNTQGSERPILLKIKMKFESGKIVERVFVV